MAKTSGLGKGLGSLIPQKTKTEVLSPDSKALAGSQQVIEIPIDEINTNPHQPRSSFEREGLEDLTNSIKEHGILQPLNVTIGQDGKYELIAGERRLRASKLLDLKTVPAIVRKVEDQQKLELALVENLQRKNLNQIEEAVAYKRLIDEFNLTQEEVAQKLGKSRTVITNTLRLLTLPTEIQKAVVEGRITPSTARVIVGLPVEQRLPFFKKILKQDLSVRAIEGEAKKISVKRHVRKSKDPNITALEDKLQQALGTKVSIKKSGSTGQISIEFYSEEELSDLIQKISD